ncbi:alpha/beta hydrolase, partial [Bacillus wiedmannii]
MVLQYKEFGDSSSPLMVFIHGGGVSGWMWDKQIKHF